jgi:uncharacterized pyridoxal phosphate-containing UPF0001 family protein
VEGVMTLPPFSKVPSRLLVNYVQKKKSLGYNMTSSSIRISADCMGMSLPGMEINNIEQNNEHYD